MIATILDSNSYQRKSQSEEVTLVTRECSCYLQSLSSRPVMGMFQPSYSCCRNRRTYSLPIMKPVVPVQWRQLLWSSLPAAAWAKHTLPSLGTWTLWTHGSWSWSHYRPRAPAHRWDLPQQEEWTVDSGWNEMKQGIQTRDSSTGMDNAQNRMVKDKFYSP